MIQTPTVVAATEYPNYINNCLRNPACELPYAAPLPAVSTLQLYVDYLLVAPGDFEFTLVDVCTGLTEQITPADYVVGQTPELGYYGVFKSFNNPATPVTTFVVHLSSGGKTFFSEMLMVEPCAPLMKVKSCHPQAATTTGFDINGIYYGLSTGGTLGDATIRYFHIAYVRRGKVKEISNKATFKSSLYFNFRTTIEKIFMFEPGELVPKWYKNVLLAIYSRGAVSFDDGQVYIVSELSFEPINDDDLTWRANVQLKETFRLFYGCDDGLCDECCAPVVTGADAVAGAPPCCDPEIISATAEGDAGSASDSGSDSVSDSASDSASDSGSAPEPDPGLRILFDDIANADILVGDASSVSDWNIYTGLTFSSVAVAGDLVVLYGAPNKIFNDELFSENDNIISVIDDLGIIEEIESNCFFECDNLISVDFPAVTNMSAGGFYHCINLVDVNLPVLSSMPAACFYLCTSLTTLNCPLITAIGNNSLAGTALSEVNFPDCVQVDGGGCSSMSNLTTVTLPALFVCADDVFSFCPAITTISLTASIFGIRAFRFSTALVNIDLSFCFDLGGTTGDDEVFNGIIGNTITLTIPTALATDGDVVYLQANNTVTLILI